MTGHHLASAQSSGIWAPTNHTPFHREMTLPAVSAVGPEKKSENENGEVPFCSDDETLKRCSGKGMTFTSAEAESD